jgi:hypothetical protein
VVERKAAVAASELASARQQISQLQEEAQQVTRRHQLEVRDWEQEVDRLTARVHHLRNKQVTTNRLRREQWDEATRLQAKLAAAEDELDAANRAISDWNDYFAGVAEQVNDILSRDRELLAIEFRPKTTLAAGVVAEGFGRNGGVIRGWVKCVRRPTDANTSRAPQDWTYLMPAVAKSFDPADNNELLMSLEADWAGGVRCYGLFEVEDADGDMQWMLVFEDAGMCLEDLFATKDAYNNPQVRGWCLQQGTTLCWSGVITILVSHVVVGVCVGMLSALLYKNHDKHYSAAAAHHITSQHSTAQHGSFRRQATCS